MATSPEDGCAIIKAFDIGVDDDTTNDMVRIHPENIPDYLRTSGLYLNFDFANFEDEGGCSTPSTQCLEFPSAALKLSPEVHSPAELEHLLNTLQYWASDDFPHTLLEYCFSIAETGEDNGSNNTEIRDETIEILKRKRSSLQQVHMILDVFCLDNTSFRSSDLPQVESAHIGSFRASSAVGSSQQGPCARYLVRAVRRGSHQILEFLLQRINADKVEAISVRHASDAHGAATHDAAAHNAAANGDAASCAYGHCASSPPADVDVQSILLNDNDRDDGAAHATAPVASLPLSQSSPTTAAQFTTQLAAASGSSSASDYNDYQSYHAYCRMAAASGSEKCLALLHCSGFLWSSSTCSAAAAHGHLDCLKYAHEHGCPWDERACERAAEGGYLNCLQYAHQHGCPIDESVSTAAAIAGHIACFQYALQHQQPQIDAQKLNKLVEWSVKSGNVECLQHLHTVLGCQLRDELCIFMSYFM